MKILRVFGFWVWFVLFCGGGLLAQNEPNPSLQMNRPLLSLRYILIPHPQAPPSTPPPSSSAYRPNVTPFRPSIAVIVAVLTTMFSLTFLLLLYAKHCRGSTGRETNQSSAGAVVSYTNRRNSGIDRSVIESLPIFRFASLRGQKEGLECSVCLNRFEPNEVLRLLPKCKHAFHVECVDTWLDAHSTCPLCRDRVEPEDVLLVQDLKPEKQEPETGRNSTNSTASSTATAKSDEFTRRISGRHSSAGERKSKFLQILIQRPGESTLPDSLIRKSVDSVMISRKGDDETASVGCFDRGGVRKDGLLLSADRENFLRRYDHKIVLSTESGSHKRWSDLRPSDLLYLQSEMLISNTGRYSLSSLKKLEDTKSRRDGEGGRSVISTRCVSEITGLDRFGVGPTRGTENIAEKRILG